MSETFLPSPPGELASLTVAWAIGRMKNGYRCYLARDLRDSNPYLAHARLFHLLGDAMRALDRARQDNPLGSWHLIRVVAALEEQP